MAWISLFIAGILEVIWAFSMKLSHGFTKPIPTVITLITMIASFALLAFSMRSLPLGTAYTIWTGIGAIGAFLVGILVLGEQLSEAFRKLEMHIRSLPTGTLLTLLTLATFMLN